MTGYKKKQDIGWNMNNQENNNTPVINIKLSDLVSQQNDPSSDFKSQSTSAIQPQMNKKHSQFYSDKMLQFKNELDPSSQPPQSIHNIQSNQRDNELYNSQYNVEVKFSSEQDNLGPLSTGESFERMPRITAEILKGIYSMNFSKPSKIQARALPLILAEPPRNLIGQSQSGTGKTAAFVLATLLRVDETIPYTQAICVAPSRELSRQIASVYESMTKFTKIKTTMLIKDTFKRQQPGTNYKSANEPLQQHIITGTPGIILDTLRRGKLINTKHLKLFILDEADNMLDQDGLGDQSLRIKNLIKGNPQILLFSATFPDYVYKFAHRFAPNPNEITLRIDQLSVIGIKQYYMDCHDEEHKYTVLCSIYDLITVSQSIIFCKRRDTASIISERMKEQGHAVGCIHGNMTSIERDIMIDEFRRGQFKVLISTNLVSRGIDISQVTLVVNYDMPLNVRGYPDPEVYLHRIGRTGRFGNTGVSVIFVHDTKTFSDMKFLEQHFKVEIKRVPTEDWQEAAIALKDAV